MSDIQEFDYSVDVLKAILWQYNDATTLQALLNSKNAWLLTNQTQYWQNWYDDVFNLETANQFGLAVWGIILGIKLYVAQPPIVDADIFGFDGSNEFNFDNGIFGNNTGGSVVLSTDIQRIALRLRYLQITSSGCVPEINRALKQIFSDYGDVWLYDYQNMKQAYMFDFTIPFEMQYMLDNYDILPRPAGVKSTYIDLTQQYFGFDGANHSNFDNGIFGENL